MGPPRAPADVAIAGGGLMGLASAWALQRAGYRVSIVDAGPIGREASWAGGGILFPIYPWKYPPPVQALAQRGRALYAGFCRQVDDISGIDSQYRQTGLCLLDGSECDAARAWCAAHDEPVEWGGPTEVATDLADAPTLFLPGVAQVRNPRLCRSLHAALVAGGACVIERAPVMRIVSENDRFAGFETPGGLVRARRGVVAAGAGRAGLLAPWVDLPIRPVKGQIILLRGAPGLLSRILIKNGRYAIPRADGRILVGSTMENTGFEQTVDGHVALQLRAAAADMMPALGDLPLERHWAGLRPATRDELPFIGSVRGLDGLYVNAGHFRNGVGGAPASAEVLLRCVKGTVEPDDRAFAPARAVTSTEG